MSTILLRVMVDMVLQKSVYLREKNHNRKDVRDSKTVIKKCQENSTDKSVIGAIIRDIQNKKADFQELIFQHTHRSENMNAHRLAKNALEKGENTYLRGVDLDSHASASVGIWPRNPD
ncbi:hypothetical protein Gogos_020512 [Gossypium gossypioides]|uniref:RNase H type-1 domain-containing protein n=1 Tax=Gossypium gossypioides TaxID=34282 RepID=A0A7J9D4D8_GOSGO|nr:hypothetical protein [Gossypium gossypioides]